MLKKLIFLPVLAFSVFAAQPIIADNHKPTCHCEKEMEKLSKNLNLTPDQVVKFKELKESNRASMDADKAKLREIKMQMNQLVMSDKIDESKLDDLLKQKSMIMASMMKTRIMAKNQMYNMLDANQKVKFQAMMKKWEEKKHH